MHYSFLSVCFLITEFISVNIFQFAIELKKFDNRWKDKRGKRYSFQIPQIILKKLHEPFIYTIAGSPVSSFHYMVEEILYELGHLSIPGQPH